MALENSANTVHSTPDLLSIVRAKVDVFVRLINLDIRFEKCKSFSNCSPSSFDEGHSLTSEFSIKILAVYPAVRKHR